MGRDSSSARGLCHASRSRGSRWRHLGGAPSQPTLELNGGDSVRRRRRSRKYQSTGEPEICDVVGPAEASYGRVLPESWRKVARQTLRKVNPNDPGELRTCPKVAPNRKAVSRAEVCADFNQTWPLLAGFGQIWSKISAEIGQFWSEWPTLATMPKIGQSWPDLTKLGRCWSNVWPSLRRIGQTLTKIDHRCAKSWPKLAKSGKSWLILVKAGRSWPSLVGIGKCWLIWPVSVRHAPGM